MSIKSKFDQEKIMPWLEEAENFIVNYKLEDVPADKKIVLECVLDDIKMLKK